MGRVRLNQPTDQKPLRWTRSGAYMSRQRRNRAKGFYLMVAQSSTATALGSCGDFEICEGAFLVFALSCFDNEVSERHNPDEVFVLVHHG